MLLELWCQRQIKLFLPGLNIFKANSQDEKLITWPTSYRQDARIFRPYQSSTELRIVEGKEADLHKLK